MSAPERPPRLPRRLARLLLGSDDSERLLDALDDEYDAHQRPERGRVAATMWYWGQVLRSIPALRRSLRFRRPSGASLRMDLLHLARTLRRSPVSAVAAVLTLAVTLGAGTATFAVVDAVLLTPPPFDRPEALVAIGQTPLDDPGAAPRAIDDATWRAWRARAASLARLEAYDPTNLTLTGSGAAERIGAANVTPGFLSALGVTPARGRLFAPTDAGTRTAVVSDRFWRGRLGADPEAVGRTLVLSGEAHAVVGVLPEGFAFDLADSDVWRPRDAGPDAGPVRVLGRLSEGVTAGELTAVLAEASLATSSPGGVRATPVAAAIVGDGARVLAVLGAAATVAMLIAFANLAMLLLVRSIDRRRELALRQALGARSSETARQLVLESTAIVALGIGGGILVALWTTPVIARFAVELGGLADRTVGVSWRAVAGVSLVAVACGCACGLLPALSAHRWRIGDVLRAGTVASARELAMRRALVAGEVALAFVLIVSMSLLGTSLARVLGTDPGFEANEALKLQVALPGADYPTAEDIGSFYAALRADLTERLGPGTVAIVDEVPLSGDGGRALVGTSHESTPHEVVVRSASPGYFDVLRVPLRSGRPFGPADDAAAPPRVIVTESLAASLFGGESAVGREVWLAGAEAPAEIVGVTADVKHRALDEPLTGTLYRSSLQEPSSSSILVVRSTLPDAAVVATVREEVSRLDGDLPVYGVQSMADLLAASPGVPARRLLTAAFTAFGLLAVLLSAIGLFGVAAHDAARRRPELALRMALGAEPARIVRAILGRSATTVGAGLAAGALITVWAVRALAHLLLGSGGVATLGIGVGAGAMLLAVGAAAVLPAALRAARSDPVAALRGEGG